MRLMTTIGNQSSTTHQSKNQLDSNQSGTTSHIQSTSVNTSTSSNDSVDKSIDTTPTITNNDIITSPDTADIFGSDTSSSNGDDISTPVVMEIDDKDRIETQFLKVTSEETVNEKGVVKRSLTEDIYENKGVKKKRVSHSNAVKVLYN